LSPSSGFQNINLYASLLSPIRATCFAHSILLDLITRLMFGEKRISWSFSICSLPQYLSSQAYRPKHPQPLLLPKCKGPSFTPCKTIGKITVLYTSYLHTKIK
jgi:hypothetical protein